MNQGRKWSEGGKWMTAQEVAEMLGVSRETVAHRMKTGLFKTKKHGRWTLIERADAEKWKGKPL